MKFRTAMAALQARLVRHNRQVARLTRQIYRDIDRGRTAEAAILTDRLRVLRDHTKRLLGQIHRRMSQPTTPPQPAVPPVPPTKTKPTRRATRTLQGRQGRTAQPQEAENR